MKSLFLLICVVCSYNVVLAQGVATFYDDFKSNKNNWLIYAFITTIFWGVWGALIDYPEKSGFPETLIYVVWSITMIIPALIAMKRIGWKLSKDRKSILYGLIVLESQMA